MSRVLVTGTAGFIGSKVAEFLLKEGHQVVGVDNMNDAYDIRVKKWRLERLRPHQAFRYHKLDIRDRQALTTTLSQYDEIGAVINLAARAGVRQSVKDPFVYADTNLDGTLNLLEVCRNRGIGKFILASTSSLYGQQNEMPYRENQNTDHPLSPYAASKKAAEAMCYTYHYLFGIDITVFRYFTVYGPAGRPDMSMLRFTQWISEGRPVIIYGDGKQSRDFTYVDDIAHGTIAGLTNVGYEVINLGSDSPIVLIDAIKTIEEAVGKKAKLEYVNRHKADVTATWANVSKAETLLGWRPQVMFETGVERLAEWYRDNREWAKEIRTD